MLVYNRAAAKYRFGDAEKYVTFEKIQSNPSGSTGAHSGHTWLRNTVRDEDHFNDFTEACDDVSDVLLPGIGHHRPSAEKIQELISDYELGHTGGYYLMSMARVALHAFATQSGNGRGNRAQFPPCHACEASWEDCLLHAGAKDGAAKLGLKDMQQAMKLVIGMRRTLPNYCLCDLACFLCLSTVR